MNAPRPREDRERNAVTIPRHGPIPGRSECLAGLPRDIPDRALRALNRVLPAPYVARADRHVWVDAPETDPRLLGRPDLYVADPLDAPPGSEAVTTLAASVAAALPYPARKGQPFLKIVDARNHRVVTAVELLSPADKTPGRDRDAYLNKRDDYLASQVNLVEMDLLRAGERPPVVGTVPPADYYFLVCRHFDFPQAGVWPLSVRDPLPSLPMPLNPDVEPPFVQLRAVSGSGLRRG